MESRRTSERKAKNAASCLIRRVASGLDRDSSSSPDSSSGGRHKTNESVHVTRSFRKPAPEPKPALIIGRNHRNASLPTSPAKQIQTKPTQGADVAKSRYTLRSELHEVEIHETRTSRATSTGVVLKSPKINPVVSRKVDGKGATEAEDGKKVAEMQSQLTRTVSVSLIRDADEMIRLSPRKIATVIDPVCEQKNAKIETCTLPLEIVASSVIVTESMHENVPMHSSRSPSSSQSTFGCSDSLDGESSVECKGEDCPAEGSSLPLETMLRAADFDDNDLKTSQESTASEFTEDSRASESSEKTPTPTDDNENKICRNVSIAATVEGKDNMHCNSNSLNGEKQLVFRLETFEVDDSIHHTPLMPIHYPSCEQNTFLGGFGLAKKSELPVHSLTGIGNRLHREVGGKLRRCIKPNVEPEMVYRHTGGKCMANVTDAQPDVHSDGSQDASKDGYHHTPSPRVTNRRASRHPVKHLVSADAVLNRCKSATTSSPSRSPAKSSAHSLARAVAMSMEKMERVSPLDMLADMALADHAATLHAENSTSRSPGSSRFGHRDQSSKAEENSTSSSADSVRRSSRNVGVKRRVWHHLLRANPDEHENEDNSGRPPPSATSEPLTVSRHFAADGHRTKSSIAKPSSSPRHHLGTVVKTEPGTLFDSPHKPAASATELTLHKSPGSGQQMRKRHRHKVVLPGAEISDAKKSRVVPSAVPSKLDTSLRDVTDTKPFGGFGAGSNTFEFISRRDESCDQPFESSILSYSYKELECLTPHMCNVCWVNDHMYCRNMKRIARDLPHYSGCIHYIACEHFRSAISEHRRHGDHHSPVGRTPSSHSGLELSLGGTTSFHWGSSGSGTSTVKTVSVEDLICTEEMVDSDASNHSIDGTELLQIQLNARKAQIFQSLGVNELPTCDSPLPPANPSVPVEIHDDATDVLVEPEEYAAEVFVDENGGISHDQLETLLLGDAVTLPHIEQEDSIKYEREETVRTLPSFDDHFLSDSSVLQFGKLLDQIGSNRHMQPPANHRLVEVEIQRISAENVLFSYPKSSSASSPGEIVQLEVSFPGGATDQAINDFLNNEAVQYMTTDISEDGNPIDAPALVDGSSDKLFGSSAVNSAVTGKSDGGSQILMVKPKGFEAEIRRGCNLMESGYDEMQRKYFGKKRRSFSNERAAPLDLRTNQDHEQQRDGIDRSDLNAHDMTTSEISRLRADLERKKLLHGAVMQDVARTTEELRSRQAQLARHEHESAVLKRQYELLHSELAAIEANIRQGHQFIDLLNEIVSLPVPMVPRSVPYSATGPLQVVPVIPIPVQTYNYDAGAKLVWSTMAPAPAKYVNKAKGSDNPFSQSDMAAAVNLVETSTLGANQLRASGNCPLRPVAKSLADVLRAAKNPLGVRSTATSGVVTVSVNEASCSPVVSSKAGSLPQLKQHGVMIKPIDVVGRNVTAGHHSDVVRQIDATWSRQPPKHRPATNTVHAVHLTVPPNTCLGVPPVGVIRLTSALPVVTATVAMAMPRFVTLPYSVYVTGTDAPFRSAPVPIVVSSIAPSGNTIPLPVNVVGSVPIVVDSVPVNTCTPVGANVVHPVGANVVHPVALSFAPAAAAAAAPVHSLPPLSFQLLQSLATKTETNLSHASSAVEKVSIHSDCMTPPLTQDGESDLELFDYNPPGKDFHLAADTLTPDPSCSSQE